MSWPSISVPNVMLQQRRQGAASSHTMTDLFAQTPTKTLVAEILFTQYITEHNIAFLATDHFHTLCKMILQ